MKHPDDGKFVVVQGSERMTGTMDESAAKQEAERLRKLQEGKQQEGQPPAEAPKVVQNLYG